MRIIIDRFRTSLSRSHQTLFLSSRIHQNNVAIYNVDIKNTFGHPGSQNQAIAASLYGNQLAFYGCKVRGGAPSESELSCADDCISRTFISSSRTRTPSSPNRGLTSSESRTLRAPLTTSSASTHRRTSIRPSLVRMLLATFNLLHTANTSLPQLTLVREL